MSTPLSQSLPRFNQQRENAKLEAEDFRLDSLTADDADGALNTIPNGAIKVVVGAVTNDANDWILLPSLANVPIGHKIILICNAGSNFELRTPAASNQLINGVDCDGGSDEFQCYDEFVYEIVKVSDTDGWYAKPFDQKLSQELTAAANGVFTAVINIHADFVTVTSGGATEYITLPSGAAKYVGKQFLVWVGANGFELVTPSGSNATINNVDSDGTNQADIGANTLSRLTLVAANTWLLENLSNLGAVNTAIVPDND